jgi:hypothetical protein
MMNLNELIKSNEVIEENICISNLISDTDVEENLYSLYFEEYEEEYDEIFDSVESALWVSGYRINWEGNGMFFLVAR